MVDIHSHILPGIDDGARTIEESLEMLRLAAASGTTDIVATPHANSEYRFDPARVEELVTELSEKTEGSITIHRGCDFHITFDNLQDALENPTKYTINHRNYLMIELPDVVSLAAMRNALGHLLDAQIIPVVTHPERNAMLQGRLSEVEQLLNDGCFIQVTGQSLLGRFGGAAQRTADSLMKAGLVHFIASDAHDTKDRTPDLSAAYKHVFASWDAETADALFVHNPRAVLWGESLTPAAPKPVKKRFFEFWK